MAPFQGATGLGKIYSFFLGIARILNLEFGISYSYAVRLPLFELDSQKHAPPITISLLRIRCTILLEYLSFKQYAIIVLYFQDAEWCRVCILSSIRSKTRTTKLRSQYIYIRLRFHLTQMDFSMRGGVGSERHHVLPYPT